MVLVVGMAVALLLAGTAAADQRTITDPNDVPSSLDIASVSHDHGRRPDGSSRFHHTITMQEQWKSKRLCDQSYIEIHVRDTDRTLKIYWDKGLRADMSRGRNRVIGHPAVWRSDKRSVDVGIRPRLLGKVDGDYRYFVGVSASSCGCGVGEPCPAPWFDRAPDSGYIRHDL